ncbi:MAG: hypothetical protein ACKOA9_02975 [Actinomycetota bacterium]
MSGEREPGHRCQRRPRLRWVFFAFGGIAAMAGALTAPAIAVPVGDSTTTTDNEPLTASLSLSVSPTRLELVAGQASAASRTVAIRATGGTPGTITVELRDAVIDGSGGWRLTTAGSTPNGLQDALRILPTSFPYDPAVGAREFRAAVSLVPSTLDRPRFGALVVTFVPAEGGGAGQVVVQGAVAMQVIAARNANELDAAARAAGTAGLRLELDELSVRQDQPWTVIDAIVPNLPRLLGHGPATIHVRGTNSGDTVLDTRVVYRIFRRNPLGILPFVGTRDTPNLVVRQRPRFLIGGQELTDEISTRQRSGTATVADALPFIGIVRVEATLSGSIAGLRAAPVTRSRTFFVLPWAEIVVIVVAYVGSRQWWRRRRRNRARSRRLSARRMVRSREPGSERSL